MALRKPLVIIAGEIQELPVTDSVATGTSEDVGVRYHMTTGAKVVPTDFQYLISGSIVIDSMSLLRVSGQAVIT